MVNPTQQRNMVRPVARTEAHILHPFLVKAYHEWYDTTQWTQKPDVIRRSVSYHIQWQNIAESLRKYRLLWDIIAGMHMAYSPKMAQRGAVSFVGKTETAIQEGASHATISSYTFAHDATGANLIVVGSTADVYTQTFSGTYAGGALTQATVANGVADRRAAWIGYRANPTTGSNNVFVDFTNSNDAGFGVAVTYSGTNGTMNNATTGNGTTANYSVNVTSATGDMVFDISVNGGTQAVTVGSGQTQRLTGNDSYWHYARASDEAGASSVTMEWTRGSTANYSQAAANIPASTSTPVTVSPSAQVATFSIPAYTVKHGSTMTPSAQVGTFSVPSYVVSIKATISPSAQVVTFTIPAYSVILADINIAANVQALTFSIPTYQVKTYVLLMPNGQTLTFTIPAYTVVTEANIVLTPNTLTLTFTLPSRTKVGAVWVKRGRSTNATWVRSTRNSN